MLVICLFDISNHKIRRKVNNILEGYGNRSQFSVYECFISATDLRKIQREIAAIIESTDKVHYYPLCSKDIKQRLASGKASLSWPNSFYIS